MPDKKYVLTRGGTGHSPHILTNADDPKDVIALCSCGGTKDPKGFCDGTHKNKKPLNCCCWFCQEQGNRAGKDFDPGSRCSCAQ